MKERQKYTQQMIARVCDFGQRHEGLFPKEAAASELLETLRRDLIDLTTHAADQVSSSGSIRTNRASRAAARKQLQFTLERMYQTARALKLEKFLMPRNQSDEALIDSGSAFAQDAESLKQDFVRQGFPLAFIEDLKSAVQNLRNATMELAVSTAKRKATIAGFDEALKKALDDLALFDALVANTLSDDPTILVEWNHARRVGRPARRKPAAPPPPSKPAAA